jgi:hypothetical protein
VGHGVKKARGNTRFSSRLIGRERKGLLGKFLFLFSFLSVLGVLQPKRWDRGKNEKQVECNCEFL